MIKVVIFDLDGTLYDEKEFGMSGFKVVSKYLSSSYDLSSDEIFRILKKDFELGLRRKNFDILLKKINLEEGVKKLVKIYREHTPSVSLHEDAKEVLMKLRGKYKLGLITDGLKKTQENKISVLGIKKYFDVIIITDVYGRDHWKPSSKLFRIALDKVKARVCIYVGDNPWKDFLGSKELGIHTVRVKRGSGEYDHINVDDEHEANYTISNLAMLKKIID
jgi:putative hydrolase of the HAD superfamily